MPKMPKTAMRTLVNAEMFVALFFEFLAFLLGCLRGFIGYLRAADRLFDPTAAFLKRVHSSSKMDAGGGYDPPSQGPKPRVLPANYPAN